MLHYSGSAMVGNWRWCWNLLNYLLLNQVQIFWVNYIYSIATLMLLFEFSRSDNERVQILKNMQRTLGLLCLFLQFFILLNNKYLYAEVSYWFLVQKHTIVYFIFLRTKECIHTIDLSLYSHIPSYCYLFSYLSLQFSF